MPIDKSRGFYSGLKYRLIARMKSYIDANTIPSVAYTDPEIAWMGITEEQARAEVEDIALTVHPHPTLPETFNFAAEVAEGTVTDIYIPKR